MRILKNTLYVLTSETYLALDGENIVLQKGGEELHRIPLHNLEGVVAFGYTGASPALMAVSYTHLDVYKRQVFHKGVYNDRKL